MALTTLEAVSYRDKDTHGDYFDIKAENIRLTKVIAKDGTKHPSNYPKFFKLGDTKDFNSLEELRPYLIKLGKNHQALAIRGTFKKARKGDKVRRIAENVENVKSKIIAIDIDDIKLPSGMSSTDLKAQGEYVCNLLHKCSPDNFPDDMGFIAQGSSGAGFSDEIKLHLWIKNWDELSQAQLRNLFYRVNSVYKKEYETNLNLVDTSLYHSAQAHYTAYPLFEDERMNPFTPEGRTVYVYGNDSYISVDYPEYVKPVKLTMKETHEFHDSVNGSKIMSLFMEKAYLEVVNWETEKRGLRLKVIACFHQAVQSQYCTRELIRLLRPVVEEKRPGQSDDYFEQGIVAALGNIKGISHRDVPLECKGIPLANIDGGDDEKYLKFTKLFPENSVTFLKATLGTGKTNTISTWLEDGTIDGRVLAITDTSALVEANAARFEAGDFRKAVSRLEFVSGRLTRLSGTLHSLPKIKDFTDKFDFIFIDEADSVMNNLLFASIISEEKKQEIINILHELLLNTDRVVISDGDISQETVNCYVELMEGQRDLNRVNFKRKNLAGVDAYKHNTEDSFWGAVQGHLDLGDKCLVVTDSSPTKLNEYYHTFSRVSPDKNITVVHSASKMDESVRDIVNRTSEALREQKVDLLLSSPSITNGVDFNYFDAVFVLTTTDNQTPNMRFQAMMRERQPETIHYFFHNKRQFSTGYRNLEFDKGFTNYARKELSLRREREFRAYIATFNYYLLESGARITVLDDPYETPREKEDVLTARDERINAILKAGSNSTITRHNDAFEERSLLRYYYEIPLNEELAWDTVGAWVDDKPAEKAEYFYKVFDIVWPYLGGVSVANMVKMLKEVGSKFYLATGESIHGGNEKAKSIIRRCGLTPESPDSMESAIKYLTKYCELTPGATLPEVLRVEQEDARDI